tara:strand:- start:602 stop:715 length:114 start_codon:yes stop_codon:yes gene_type:complete
MFIVLVALQIIQFAQRHNVIILSDEVYQENVMAENKT